MSKFGKTISKLNRSPPGAEGKTADVLLPDYHNYTELISELEQLADSYPTTSQLYIQGSTVEGRQLAVIRISDKVQQVATIRENNVGLWSPDTSTLATLRSSTLLNLDHDKVLRGSQPKHTMTH